MGCVANATTASLSRVLFGTVYICAGQVWPQRLRASWSCIGPLSLHALCLSAAGSTAGSADSAHHRHLQSNMELSLGATFSWHSDFEANDTWSLSHGGVRHNIQSSRPMAIYAAQFGPAAPVDPSGIHSICLGMVDCR